MKDVIGVTKPGWLMQDGTNAVVESGVLGCWLVDWMKAAECVDRVGWWVADEMNDVLGEAKNSTIYLRKSEGSRTIKITDIGSLQRLVSDT